MIGRSCFLRESKMEIINCTWKFSFQCSRMWSALRETGDPKVRFCEACLKEVHLCRTQEELSAGVARGDCVAMGFWRGYETLGKVVPVERSGRAGQE